MRGVFRNMAGVGSVLLLVGASVAFVARASAPRAERSAEDIYLDKCAVCHGKDGAGKTAKGKKSKVKDLRETLGKMSEAEMIKVVEVQQGADQGSGRVLSHPRQIVTLIASPRAAASPRGHTEHRRPANEPRSHR